MKIKKVLKKKLNQKQEEESLEKNNNLLENCVECRIRWHKSDQMDINYWNLNQIMNQKKVYIINHT